jgi:uncharacterized membrane protein
MTKKTRLLLLASLTGVIATPAIVSLAAGDGAKGKGKPAPCYGVNKCKGVGDCAGVGTSCAGSNSCKHLGYIDMDAQTCLRLDNGRLTAAEPPAADAAPVK